MQPQPQGPLYSMPANYPQQVTLPQQQPSNYQYYLPPGGMGAPGAPAMTFQYPPQGFPPQDPPLGQPMQQPMLSPSSSAPLEELPEDEMPRVYTIHNVKCLEESWIFLKQHWGIVLGSNIIWSLSLLPYLISIGLFLSYLRANQDGTYSRRPDWLTVLSFIFEVVLSGPMRASPFVPVAKQLRGETPTLAHFFHGFKFFKFLFVQQLIGKIATYIGFRLFILPGIYLTIILYWAPFLIVDRAYEPFQSIKASVKQVRRNFWGTLAFALALIGIFVAAFLVCSLLLALPKIAADSDSKGLVILVGVLVLLGTLTVLFVVWNVCAFATVFAYRDACGLASMQDGYSLVPASPTP